jgi:predicted 3-demethylubiquinone-9 3-methyltransferase (glyoxalase superfamily)
METENATLTTGAGKKGTSITTTQQITPFLWFEDRLEEAVSFYTTVFADSEIVSISRLPAEAPGKDGKMVTATFRLNGVEFYALQGGPMFKFTGAISFFVKCETQAEVDHYWDSLGEGGNISQCGWLTDKFGITWQIVPNALGRLMGDPNSVKARNVMNAMMKMIKLDIAGLQAAYDKE